MSRRIPLSQGLFAIVDDEDYAAASQFKWSVSRKPHSDYAVRAVRKPDGRKTTQYLHAFLTGNTLTDHADGNGLNNRRSNLRAATSLQNQGNTRKARGASSRYKGVCFRARRGKWQATCAYRDESGHLRQASLGYFEHEDDAARAYDVAARDRWGEFAALNFPRPGERSAITGGIA